jgi:hypothetical protein
MGIRSPVVTMKLCSNWCNGPRLCIYQDQSTLSTELQRDVQYLLRGTLVYRNLLLL